MSLCIIKIFRRRRDKNREMGGGEGIVPGDRIILSPPIRPETLGFVRSLGLFDANDSGSTFYMYIYFTEKFFILHGSCLYVATEVGFVELKETADDQDTIGGTLIGAP